MIDQEDIKKYKEYAQQKTGSKKEADGSYKWKDNKVGNQFDALLEKSGYIMQSPPINDLDNADVAVSGPAQRKVRDKYESGSYTMKDLDVKVLEKSINELADGLKTGKFLNQFKDLDAAKQSALINALKKAADGGNASAKEKLAHIKGIDYGFKEDEVEAKQKFTRGLTISDLNKIIAEGNAEQNDALVKAVNGQMTNLASQVQRAIMGGNKQAVAIKDILGIK